MQSQSVPREQHPAWILGHLLLADTYLLFLLTGRPLSDDFTALLELYGPASVPNTETQYHAKNELLERLRQTNTDRIAHITAMADIDFARPLPDATLARVQPTIGHHLHSLVFHEGYHGGQLSAWRKQHEFKAVRWTMGVE